MPTASVRRSPPGRSGGASPRRCCAGWRRAASPASSRSSLMRLNSALGMNTSPRASSDGGLREPCRDDRDRLQVRGHVLAGRAVAAGRALGEPTAVVAQADREAIDLELGAVAQVGGGFGRRRQAEALAHARIEPAQLVVAERVRERQHRTGVADLVERGAGRCPADTLRRRLRGDQLRVGRLERDQLAEQLVVLGVADLRGVLDVVELVGPVDLSGQRRRDAAWPPRCRAWRRSRRARGRRAGARSPWMRGYRTSRSRAPCDDASGGAGMVRRRCRQTTRSRSCGRIAALRRARRPTRGIGREQTSQRRPCRPRWWSGRAGEQDGSLARARSINSSIWALSNMEKSPSGGVIGIDGRASRRCSYRAPVRPANRWREGHDPVAVRSLEQRRRAQPTRWDGPMSSGVGVPSSARASSNSSRRMAIARSTPAAPAAASAQYTGRPTSTPWAPSAGDRDVEAAADAAVDPDLRPAVDRGDDLGEDVDGRQHAIELAATVVAHDDGVDAVLDGEPGVLGSQDALDDEWQRRPATGSCRGRPTRVPCTGRSWSRDGAASERPPRLGDPPRSCRAADHTERRSRSR